MAPANSVPLFAMFGLTYFEKTIRLQIKYIIFSVPSLQKKPGKIKLKLEFRVL